MAASGERLADALAALASEHRLSVLGSLDEPLRLREIRVCDRTGRGGARGLARQTVRRHLNTLLDAGLVVPLLSMGDRGPRFVANRARLVELSEELRRLAAHRPPYAHPSKPQRAPAWVHPDATGPRLVLVRGIGEGRAFPLTGRGPWRIGRSEDAHVRLDWDACVEARHAALAFKDRHFVAHDEGSLNGVYVNFERIAEPRTLRHGDAVCIGRSVLLFWSE